MESTRISKWLVVRLLKFRQRFSIRLKTYEQVNRSYLKFYRESSSIILDFRTDLFRTSFAPFTDARARRDSAAVQSKKVHTLALFTPQWHYFSTKNVLWNDQIACIPSTDSTLVIYVFGRFCISGVCWKMKRISWKEFYEWSWTMFLNPIVGVPNIRIT